MQKEKHEMESDRATQLSLEAYLESVDEESSLLEHRQIIEMFWDDILHPFAVGTHPAVDEYYLLGCGPRPQLKIFWDDTNYWIEHIDGRVIKSGYFKHLRI